MNLDVRIPMGWLLLILGGILVIYGLASDPIIYVQHSLRHNVNLLWGVIFALVGTGALVLARRSSN